MNEKILDRFWNKVNKTDTCWFWTGYKKPNGYGQVKIKTKHFYAHRIAYQIVKGSIPNDFCVCHTCDTPSCVNPAHLFLGTRQDNTADMVNKGRQQKEQNHWNAKLNPGDITTIRTLYPVVSMRELAKEYNVSVATVCNIINFIGWKRV